MPLAITPSDILNGRILVVDDQEMTARMLTEMLREAGCSATSFTTNASEVGELHRTHRYDLILLDLQMPGMNGFHVMEELSEIESEGYVPVLAITAEPSHKPHALRAGAKDFISKPFDPEEGQTRIRNMLEVRLLHDQARS